MNELVSIVMPVYNAEAFLEVTVASAQSQTYTDWELIAVDDCSTDKSFALLTRLAQADPRIRPIRQEHNQGAAKARNAGLLNAKGRYLAYLDADDLWQPRKLEKELAFLKQKQAAFVFTGYEFGDEQAKGTGRIVHVPEVMTYEKALSRTVIFTTTVLFDMDQISRDLLKMPEVKSEDTATWWKILRNGYTAYGLDENLAVYRRPSRSLSSNKFKAIRRIWFLYRQEERLSVLKSAWHFCFWAFGAVARRV